jgi:hypothetical protein
MTDTYFRVILFPPLKEWAKFVLSFQDEMNRRTALLLFRFSAFFFDINKITINLFQNKAEMQLSLPLESPFGIPECDTYFIFKLTGY